jgi:hypothetical protein
MPPKIYTNEFNRTVYKFFETKRDVKAAKIKRQKKRMKSCRNKFRKVVKSDQPDLN